MIPNRVRNNMLWKQAVATAKRIGGRRKNEMDYIMSIYKRLGGTLKTKSYDNKMKKKTVKRNPLDTIGLQGGKYGSKSS